MACTSSTYTLGGTNLASLGFQPKAPIALSGIWDMPSRINKTHHNWSGENFVEPYIRQDEIFYGGRDLVLRGYIPYNDATDLGDSYYGLNALIDGFTTPVNLSNSVLGTFIVTVTSFTIVELCPTGYAEIAISFRESEVDTWGNVPSSMTLTSSGINGYAWGDFGAYLQSYSGVFDRGASKILPVSVYDREATRTRTRGSYNGSVTLIFRGATISSVASNIGGFAQVMGSEGMKILEIGDGLYRQVFVTNGFTTELVRYTSKQVIARVVVGMTEIETAREVAAFDFSGDEETLLGNNHNEAIGYIIN